MRWSHSQKKIALNAASDMPRLISLYSGICLYFSNSASHAASLSGGSTPVTGSHSVIDRPDSVRRVMPPTATTAITSSATAHNQRDSAAGRDLANTARVMRSEEHTSELQSLMRNSYAGFCLKKK